MMFHFHPKWRRPVVLTLSLIAIGLSTARIALAIADMYRIDELPLTPAVSSQARPEPVRNRSEAGPALAAALRSGLSSEDFWQAFSSGDVDLGQGRRAFTSSDLPLLKTVLENDVVKLVDSVPVDIKSPDGARPFFVEGWRCSDLDPQLYKLIKLTNGHSYKTRGEFIHHSDGTWVGELDPILGLISTSGLSLELRRTLLNGGFVEITPTVDDAAHALLAWIKHLDHWIEKNRHPNTDNAVIVSSYLRSRKEIDDLIVAQRKSHDKYVQIGAWNVDCEDSRWWREVGLGGKSWADIEGRFVIDDNGQFEIVVVGAYLLFVNGRGDSKTIQSTPFVTSTH
jgi:hypothetical protein